MQYYDSAFMYAKRRTRTVLDKRMPQVTDLSEQSYIYAYYSFDRIFNYK